MIHMGYGGTLVRKASNDASDNDDDANYENQSSYKDHDS